ncbi:MAG: ATP-dependent zinc metalloprotease FtsH [Chlamydiae bacterium]|nr:ATP-dependent zinc metalloprotease FtsH [Chlamydiota bacterium]
MANKKSTQEPKKGIPGGFLLFILAIILIVFSVQTMTSEKGAKVAFSYQLEHLVNLDLINPEESKKIAQNDNLVTFLGKFRDKETETGKNRYSYLELLNKNHELILGQTSLDKELGSTQKSVENSALWFLNISGATPNVDFVVVSSAYDFPDRKNGIIVKPSKESDVINLKMLESRFSSIEHNKDYVASVKLQADLSTLISYFRATSLGIGDETLKQKLKNDDQLLSSLTDNTTSNDRINAYFQVFKDLNDVVNDLSQEKDGIRLLQLRSVRSYKEAIDSYINIEKELETNIASLAKARQKVDEDFWFFNDKEISTRTLEKQDFDVFGHWFVGAKKEWDSFSLNATQTFKAPDQPRTLVLEKLFQSQQPSTNYFNYIFTALPIVVVLLLVYFLFSRQMKGVGSSAMNFGKSPAKLLTKESNKVTFKDVAGADEAKEELSEIVDFLKDPQKFTALGAKIPKGVLLIGPPGTGKTLIAKAVAGEADRPFFTISGSDFVEMFVGVGASRVRDLFDQAKKNAPCIIFMDEIDAVGRHRGAGIGGGHDEREQTLNQLLVEMDGFDTKEGVILVAATNRPDILDKALLRPGRFDRKVMLDLPDIKGRYEILKVHARKIKIDPSVDLMDIAKSTPGSSGADLENILNEAALLAARKGRKAVTSSETQEACDKVRFGKERRSLEMDQQEKLTTAFHESGHAIVGLTVEHGDPVDKVTIIPRGLALGATHFMPKKNRLSYWKKEILDQLTILMGGRAAEEIFVKDLSSGAQQDISQATRLARAMICEWGMSDDLGAVTYDERSGNQYLGSPAYQEKLYSEETAQKIDKEVYGLLEDAHKRASVIIEKNKDKLQLMTDMLMEFETLDKQDVKEIMEGSWDAEKKKQRVKVADELQKKTPPPPPTKKEELVKKEGPKPLQADGLN